jgi:hypothetical protein
MLKTRRGKTRMRLGRHFRLRPGFEIELVASEPLIASPVAIDFGADGGLWVCEMRDYPSGIDGKGKPGGCIKRLSDTNNDGRYDTAEIWADDLPFPTGLMAWHDGVLVCAAPDVWFLSPSRQRPRIRRTCPSTAQENPQRICHGQFSGARERIALGIGRLGLRLRRFVRRQNHRAQRQQKSSIARTAISDFVRTRASSRRSLGSASKDTVRDDFDEWFGNDNSTLLWHFPLPDRYRKRNPYFAGPAPRVSRSRDADPGKLYPVSRTLTRFNSPESANRITSGCWAGDLSR